MSIRPATAIHPSEVAVWLRTATYPAMRMVFGNLEMAVLQKLDQAVSDEVLSRYRPVKKPRAVRKRRSTQHGSVAKE